MEGKPKVLAVGDAVVPTGFARVLQGLFQHLHEDYEIHHLGINFHGDPHDFEWKIYPAYTGGDVYGLNRLESLINKIDPDIVFILNDIWVHSEYSKTLEKYKDDIKIILYAPVDAGPIDYKWVDKLNIADRFMVYTQFGKEIVNESVKFIRDYKDEDFYFPEIEILPHGVDLDKFYPFPDGVNRAGEVITPGKIKAKRDLYPNEPEFLDSFIVLNANRNQPRKRIDVTMKGFAMFAEDKPDNVKLYLHMGIEDVGWNIISLAERLRIDDRLIVSSTSNSIPGVPDWKLNQIYNGTDVGINTSIGEGWGLIPFEHAATGAPQILPNHSALAEIWKGAAEFMEPRFQLTTERVMTEGSYVIPEDVAESLQRVYEDDEYRQELALKAYSVTQRDEYRWKNIADRLDSIFQEVLNE